MTKSFTYLDATEKRFVSMWHKRNMTITEIAGLLDRAKGTISRHVRNKNSKKVGRPTALTDTAVDRSL